MNKVKHYFAFLLLSLCSMVSYAYDFEVDGIFYNIISASNLEVEVTYSKIESSTWESYNKTPYSGDITIPETVVYNNKKYTVTSIGVSAFGDIRNPSGRHGTSVTSVILPNTVQKISGGAFANCQELYFIKLPNSLQEIGIFAFERTKIPSITIPNKVTSIGESAFWGCKQLEKAIIGKNVENIYSQAFEACSKLTEVVFLGDKVIGDKTSVFSLCHSALEIYLVRDYITFDTNEFKYTGTAPSTNWKNGLKQYTCNLTFPELEKDAGKHEVICEATFSGDVNFTCEVPYSYTINKAPLSISANNASKIYGNTNPEFEAVFDGFINKEDKSVLSKYEFSTTATTSSDAGTYPIHITAEALNYEITATDGTLTVNKAPLTATVNKSEKVYGEENPSFAVEYSGLKNNDTDPQLTKELTFTTEATKQSNIGTYPVTASNGEFKNYEITKYVAGTLTINKAPLTIICNDATKAYGDVNPSFSFTYTGLKNDDTEDKAMTLKPSVDTEVTRSTTVGDYDIIGSNGSAKNYTIEYIKGKLTITKAPLVITANDATREYGNSNPTFTFIFNGFKNEETKDVLSSQPIATSVGRTSDAGEYNIISDGAAASNYDISYGIGKLTITKAPLEVKVNDVSRLYGENNPEFTLTYTGFKNDDDKSSISIQPTVTTDATKDSPVGFYSLTASGGSDKNYEFKKYTGATLTIGKSELIVTVTNQQMVYGDALPTLTYTCSGLKNKDTNVSAFSKVPSLICEATKNSNCGEYPILISDGVSDNYVITYNNGTMTVEKRELVTTVGNYSRPFNTENPSFELKFAGFVNGDDITKIITKPTITCDATKTSDTGNYTISLYGGNSQNYSFAFVEGKLTIEKAEQEIVWEETYENVEIGSQIELTAKASSGLDIEYIVSDENIAQLYTAGKDRKFLDCTKEGTITVKATQNGDKNYYSAPIISKTITINNPTGIHDISNYDDSNSTLKIYNINGQRVKNNSKGIIIINGKKYLNR